MDRPQEDIPAFPDHSRAGTDSVRGVESPASVDTHDTLPFEGPGAIPLRGFTRPLQHIYRLGSKLSRPES